jgi:hypothetical protein
MINHARTGAPTSEQNGMIDSTVSHGFAFGVTGVSWD